MAIRTQWKTRIVIASGSLLSRNVSFMGFLMVDSVSNLRTLVWDRVCVAVGNSHSGVRDVRLGAVTVIMGLKGR